MNNFELVVGPQNPSHLEDIRQANIRCHDVGIFRGGFRDYCLPNSILTVLQSSKYACLPPGCVPFHVSLTWSIMSTHMQSHVAHICILNCPSPGPRFESAPSLTVAIFQKSLLERHCHRTVAHSFLCAPFNAAFLNDAQLEQFTLADRGRAGPKWSD